MKSVVVTKPCPVKPCKKHVMPSQIMCQKHWEIVSDETKTALREEKDRKDGPTFKKLAEKAATQVTSDVAAQQESEDFTRNW